MARYAYIFPVKEGNSGFLHDLMSQKGTIDDGDSGKDVIIVRNSQV